MSLDVTDLRCKLLYRVNRNTNKSTLTKGKTMLKLFVVLALVGMMVAFTGCDKPKAEVEKAAVAEQVYAQASVKEAKAEAKEAVKEASAKQVKAAEEPKAAKEKAPKKAKAQKSNKAEKAEEAKPAEAAPKK